LSEEENAAVARRLSGRSIDRLARGVAESPWGRRRREVAAYRVRKAPRDAARLTGDQEARRRAQELIRADAAAR
jgi:hypothetical protein